MTRPPLAHRLPTLLQSRTFGSLALYGLISAVFCAPLFQHPLALPVDSLHTDWDVHLFYAGSFLKNVVGYGQMPSWNPWYCGGNVLWQNPQVPLLSLVYLFALAMPFALAVKLNIVVHYWIGFVGMHLVLTRVMGITRMPTVLYLASLFVLSGSLALHLSAGHFDFMPAFYLPLLLFFALKSISAGSTRDVAFAGAVLALAIYNGGLHIVPMVVLLVGTLCLVAAVIRRRWLPVLAGCLIGIAGFSYAMPRLLPMAQFIESPGMTDTRFNFDHPDTMSSEMLWGVYTDAHQSKATTIDANVQKYDWWEYGNYVGLLGVGLCLGSVAWIFVNRRAPERWLGVSLAVTFVFMLALSAGEFSAFAPATLIARLPLFSNFRIPSRYTVAVPLMGSLCIAWVVKALAIERSPRRVGLTIDLLCGIAVLQLLIINGSHVKGLFAAPPLDQEVQRVASDTFMMDSTSLPSEPRLPMLRTLASGKAFLNCYEPLQLRRTMIASLPLVQGEDDTAVAHTAFTPNHVSAEVTVGARPSRLVLNQNFSSGWSSTAGTVGPDPVSGSPSVLLPAGFSGHVRFDFVPPGFWWGVAIFALAAAFTWRAVRADGSAGWLLRR